jgi:thiamine phosphate synthase YjbQ (UPF0047 family)
LATREELIATIEKCILLEDAVVPLYTQHISSTIFLSEFDSDLKSTFLSSLKRLGDDSAQHKIKLEALLNTIKESDRDVY